MLQAIVRTLLFVPSIFVGGEWVSCEGSWWDRFLMWTYGEDAWHPLHAFTVQWPED